MKRSVKFRFVFIVLYLLVIFCFCGCSKGLDFLKEKSLGESDLIYKKGDCITLGKYEQDEKTENGSESIEWIVLDVKDGKALVISKYALDCKAYSTKWESTWETCTLREWLNDDFYNSAFTRKEKDKIITTTVKSEDNDNYGVFGGEDTKDKVFLLSASEVEKYFENEGTCKLTAYGRLFYNSTYESGNCYWWLRSPGYRTNCTACVNQDGSINDSGFSQDSCLPVRPAMWIDAC